MMDDVSGHSKWATIKRDKAANDAKKSRSFTKISRLLSVAAKKGGGDPDTNASLRLAVEKAREARMPKDNIDRAIDKGLGVGGLETYEDAIYEGYGPLSVAVLIHALTDNKNRTVSEVRNVFSRFGGSLGSAGSTAYIFSGREKAPMFYVESEDKEVISKVTEFLETLEGSDDIQDVYHNFKK